MIKPKAQVTLEVSLALMMVFIFMLGTTRVFIWINQRAIKRQEKFQEVRTQIRSGSIDNEIVMEESKFHIFH